MAVTTGNSPNILRKVVAFFVTAFLFTMVLMFSMLVFAAALTVGAVAWAYLWWKTRALRKQMRARCSGGGMAGGEVIEGEAIRVIDSR